MDKCVQFIVDQPDDVRRVLPDVNPPGLFEEKQSSVVPVKAKVSGNIL